MQPQHLALALPAPTGNLRWVRHPGVEAACNRLGLWLVNGGMLWLASDEAAGKTRLLAHLEAESPGLALVRVPAADARASYAQVRGWVEDLAHEAFWAVDVPAGHIHRASMIALFHLIERARAQGRPLVLAWRPPPRSAMPPELSSRLFGTLERIELAPPPDDRALIAVMRAMCEDMQWHVDERVLEAMLAVLPRRLDIVAPALRHLESVSLRHRKSRLGQAWVMDELMAWLRQRGTSSRMPA